MAYVDKALNWSPIQWDDAQSLKGFSFFQRKCKKCMTELKRSTSKQTIARKLPPHLQSKWRDRVVKTKDRGRTAKFEDIAEFIKSAAESANDPIYSRQALL